MGTEETRTVDSPGGGTEARPRRTGTVRARAARRADRGTEAETVYIGIGTDASDAEATRPTPSLVDKEKGRDKETKAVTVPPKELAGFFILLLESFCVQRFGPEARLQPQERALIQEPLIRILNRLPTRVAEKAGQLADPLALMWGLGMYWLRISQLRPQKAETEPKQTANDTASNIANTNGSIGAVPFYPSDVDLVRELYE